MIKAKYYEQDYQGKENTVRCTLCPRYCQIQDGKIGFCNVRKNVVGKLYTLVYGKLTGLQIDPIEKKPLFHFLPGSKVLSFGTVGCNLRCKHCQNWHTSQTKPGEYPEEEVSPEQMIQLAKEHGCESIAATYNEPTIFFEYCLDIFKLAKAAGIRTVMVSNGFTCLGPAKELAPHLDGINVDLKGFTQQFYGTTTASFLKDVLASIEFWAKQKHVLLEVTNLVIPTLNDDLDKIEEMCLWLKEHAGADVPLHFSAFHPDYKLDHLPSTSAELLDRAWKIAKDVGMRYVYVGNLRAGDKENTHCPECNALLIKRHGFLVVENHLKEGCCSCGEMIAGVW
ncbi:MAG: AmmeMemoRadiSam system radical SAM enzyme [Nanoarchaeota archaeon]